VTSIFLWISSPSHGPFLSNVAKLHTPTVIIIMRDPITSFSTIQINHQPDATIFHFIILTFILTVFLCMTTLTEVFPCFFLSCKANARVKPAKTGHGPHSSYLLSCSLYFCVVLRIFVLFYELFVLWRSLYCTWVLNNCHRVAIQLQLNISYHITSFTAQHVSGVLPPIIRSSMIAVAASGFTFVSWW